MGKLKESDTERARERERERELEEEEEEEARDMERSTGKSFKHCNILGAYQPRGACADGRRCGQ